MICTFLSTSNYHEGIDDSYIDDIEYRNGYLMHAFYPLTFENAKTDKFKALCLKLEDYALHNING